MLILQQVCFLATKYSIRNYAKKSHKMSLNIKQVHQEVMRYVTPFARINITSDIPLKIRPADVHSNPNGNAFIAELHGDAMVKNCPATMQVNVSSDETQVDVVLAKIADNKTFHCEMELPVRAELFINSKDAVDVSNVEGDNVNINANKDIRTKHIRAETVTLLSRDGSVTCMGMLLGKNTRIETLSKGNISLDKLQGDKLFCKTNTGNIRVKSCYVMCSNFETENGKLELSNIHKSTTVNVHEQGDIIMTGIHGNLHLNTNGGNMNLQLSELDGESEINGKSLKRAVINITDDIASEAKINLKTKNGICLKDSLDRLKDSLSDDKKSLNKCKATSEGKKLMANIDCETELEFGKLSWEEMMQKRMSKV